MLARVEGRAGEAIRRTGATHDALEAEFRRAMATCEEPYPTYREGVTTTPRVAAVHARAEGLALARAEEPDEDDLLVALLWEPDSLAAGLLRPFGGRAAVAAAFEELGGRLPADLPSDRVWPELGERVWVPHERLMDVVHAVHEVTHEYGFNTTRDGRAWVRAASGVDVEAIAARVLADA